jgi:hypothetical protein
MQINRNCVLVDENKEEVALTLAAILGLEKDFILYHCRRKSECLCLCG